MSLPGVPALVGYAEDTHESLVDNETELCTTKRQSNQWSDFVSHFLIFACRQRRLLTKPGLFVTDGVLPFIERVAARGSSCNSDVTLSVADAACCHGLAMVE